MPIDREIDPNDAEVLRHAIAVSGLSAQRFAVEILVRDERTVRRWIALQRPIPAVVVERCRQIVATE